MSSRLVVQHRSGFAGAHAHRHAAARYARGDRSPEQEGADPDEPLALTREELETLVDQMVARALERVQRESREENSPKRANVRANYSAPPRVLSVPTTDQLVVAVRAASPSPLRPPSILMANRQQPERDSPARFNRMLSAPRRRAGGAQ